MEEEDINPDDIEDEEEKEEEDRWRNRKIKWSIDLNSFLENVPKKTKDISKIQELELYKKVKLKYEIKQLEFLRNISASIEEQLTRKGTANDQINAICLQISRGGIFRLDLISRLLNFCEDSQYRRSSQSIEAISSMFLYHLIPNRRLKYFSENNLFFMSKQSESFDNYEDILLRFFFENELKKQYRQFLDILQRHLKSKGIDAIKHYVLKMFRILCYRIDEGREVIREALFSVLKSPRNPFAFKVLYLFSTMINPDRNFYCFIGKEKESMVKSVINLIFSVHNQVVVNGVELLLSFKFNKEKEMNLILLRLDIVLKILDQLCREKYLGKKGFGQQKGRKKKKKKKKRKQDTKINNDLLIKVLKSLRFSVPVSPIEKFLGHIDLFFNIGRKSNFAVSVEATNVLFHILKRICKEEGGGNDDQQERLLHRYYMLLYSLITKFDGFSFESKSSSDFLNLLKCSILFDPNVTRAKSFVKRLLQILYYTSPNFTTSGLAILRAILIKKKHLEPVFIRGGDNKTKKSVVPPPPLPPVQGNKKNKMGYNPNEMNPNKSGVENEPYWDILSLREYYHPLASDIASSMVGKKRSIPYKGDSMKDFHTTGVIDEFIHLKQEEEEEEEQKEEEEEEDGEEKEKEKEVPKLSFLEPFFPSREKLGDGNEGMVLHNEARFDDLIEDSKKKSFFRGLEKDFDGEEEEEEEEDELEDEDEEDDDEEEDDDDGNKKKKKIRKKKKLLKRRTGKKRRRILDFSDNRIERIFLGLEDGEGDWEKELLDQQPTKKRRKLTHVAMGDTKHMQEEISVFHEEQEEREMNIQTKKKKKKKKIVQKIPPPPGLPSKRKFSNREGTRGGFQRNNSNRNRYQPKPNLGGVKKRWKGSHVKFNKKKKKKKKKY